MLRPMQDAGKQLGGQGPRFPGSGLDHGDPGHPWAQTAHHCRGGPVEFLLTACFLGLTAALIAIAVPCYASPIDGGIWMQIESLA